LIDSVSWQPWLPAWILTCLGQEEIRLHTDEQRMDFVLYLAKRNLVESTGGPFAAAVFGRDSGLLVSVGVERTQAFHCSHAHAEMIALGLAQQHYNQSDLSALDKPVHELVCSCEPCAMCLGAIELSGIKRLVYAADEQAAKAVGVYGGLKPTDWQQAFAQQGIDVMPAVCRTQAVELLSFYKV